MAVNMDFQTLPVSETDGLSQIVDIREPWGLLYSLNSVFPQISLTNETHSFGRNDENDFVLHEPRNEGQLKYWKTYSRTQFVIKRSNGDVTIEDHSSNGTFVNGKKLGKKQSTRLHHNSEIALSFKHNKAYVFVDLNADEKNRYPNELTEKYRICNVLGSGACGEVRCAFDKSGQAFAVKIVTKSKFGITSKIDVHSVSGQALKEAEILRQLNHPNIIHIIELFESNTDLFLMLEFVAGGELFDKIVSCEKLSESFTKFIAYQMLAGVDYLHSQGLTHRDLKPENVLLSHHDIDDPVVKITDFGLSKFAHPQTHLKTFCGTPTYLAPEVLKSHGSGEYTLKIDCWSLGVILFCCLAGYPPFTDERHDKTLSEQILTADYSFPDALWSSISGNAKQLLRCLMTLDEEQRYHCRQALSHAWFTDDDVDERVVDRAKRVMAEEASRLQHVLDTVKMPSPPPLSPRSREGSQKKMTSFMSTTSIPTTEKQSSTENGESAAMECEQETTTPDTLDPVVKENVLSVTPTDGTTTKRKRRIASKVGSSEDDNRDDNGTICDVKAIRQSKRIRRIPPK